ncbi:mechanosensitive ion channel domain-containing protein [Phenylobacterium sp.]|uniref:mechanosensitive ion channel family protein n=1 Tax=Phenylobacterium sp. TaxID=1871053 RepID=UPI00286CE746|nr:mechanosensitive ion channel domain-containing protein [Phenylobacterium sp.]
MQEFKREVSRRLSDTITADEDVIHKFIDAAGDLAVNLVVAVIILMVTFWAAGWASRLVRRVLARAHRQGPPDVTLQSFGGSLARYVVIIVGLIAVLQQIGVQTTSILAVVGAASLAVGLALQGTLSNVAAGVMLLLFRPYRVGDVVEIAGRTGTVQALDLFVTELATPDNIKVVMPNAKVFGDVIVNTSHHARRRVDAVVRVDTKRDVPALLMGLKIRAESNPLVLTDPAPLAEVTGMSEAFVELAVRAWVEREDYAVVKADMMLAARLLADSADAPLPPPPAARIKPAPPPRKPRKTLVRRLRG